MYSFLLLHLKRDHLDTQFIFSIFRQPIHVSVVSTAHHQEVHRMDTTVGTYCSFQMTISYPSQDKRQSANKNNKYQLLYPYGVPPDDGL
jgi:fructose-1,6-bisphosphatase